MFGCCVAGRLLQTNLQQVDETHALFEIPAAEKVNHVCVFLIGTGQCYDDPSFKLMPSAHIRSETLDTDLCAVVPFPEGFGATVHFYWPGKGSQVLGMYVYPLHQFLDHQTYSRL